MTLLFVERQYLSLRHGQLMVIRLLHELQNRRLVNRQFVTSLISLECFAESYIIYALGRPVFSGGKPTLLGPLSAALFILEIFLTAPGKFVTAG